MIFTNSAASMLDYLMSRRAQELPEPQAALRRVPDRLDPLCARTGRRHLAHALVVAQGRRTPSCRRRTTRTASSRASSKTRSVCRCSTASASTRCASKPTIRIKTARGPRASRRPSGCSATSTRRPLTNLLSATRLGCWVSSNPRRQTGVVQPFSSPKGEAGEPFSSPETGAARRWSWLHRPAAPRSTASVHRRIHRVGAIRSRRRWYVDNLNRMGAETAKTPYPKVDRADYPAIERRILERWKDRQTFERSVDTPARRRQRVHLLRRPAVRRTGCPTTAICSPATSKTSIPRYQTMRGRRVERRFGWDCHGLPAEMEAEKELRVSGRRAITEYGIDKFNDYCRTSVLRYTKEWETYVTRQARWVDFDNDYKTMDLCYMESVMWAFKQLWDKGLVYEAYRVMPYSWGAETPLSNFEIRLDDATRPRQDPALTVAFTLDAAPRRRRPETRILAWTTTPWTLPSNLALAVGARPRLRRLRRRRRPLHPRRGHRRRSTQKELAERDAGQDRQGLDARRAHLHSRCSPTSPAPPTRTRCLARRLRRDRRRHGRRASSRRASARSTKRRATPRASRPSCPSTTKAASPTRCPTTPAQRVRGQPADHPRTSATPADSCATTAIRTTTRTAGAPTRRSSTAPCRRGTSRSPRSATASSSSTSRSTGSPGTCATARSASGSKARATGRSRATGSGARPIPVWRSDNPEYPRTDVYGSIDELEARLRRRGHRPAPPVHRRTRAAQPRRPHRQVDDAPRARGARLLVRVRVDAVRAGALPVREQGVGRRPQRRLHRRIHRADARLVLHDARAVGGAVRPPRVQELHLPRRRARRGRAQAVQAPAQLPRPRRDLRDHRLRRVALVPDVVADLARPRSAHRPRGHGPSARSCGWCSTRSGTRTRSSRSTRTSTATAPPLRADSTQLLDRYILAKTAARRSKASRSASTTTTSPAPAPTSSRSSTRSTTGTSAARVTASGRRPVAATRQDKHDAYDTLYTVLHTVTRVAAPLLPFLCEEVYTERSPGDESVHLTDWPDPRRCPPTTRAGRRHGPRPRCLLGRSVAARSTRAAHAPAARAGSPSPAAISSRCAPFADLISDEVNVKAVEFTDDVAAFGTFVLRPNGKVLGPRLGGDMQQVHQGGQGGRLDDATTTARSPWPAYAQRRRFELALQANDGDATARAARQRCRRQPRHRSHPGSRARGHGA